MPATAPPSSALATWYQPRPASTTPVERATSSASRLEMSYSAPPVQDMSCPGPATNPSRDIATCKRTMLLRPPPRPRFIGREAPVKVVDRRQAHRSTKVDAAGARKRKCDPAGLGRPRRALRAPVRRQLEALSEEGRRPPKADEPAPASVLSPDRRPEQSRDGSLHTTGSGRTACRCPSMTPETAVDRPRQRDQRRRGGPNPRGQSSSVQRVPCADSSRAGASSGAPQGNTLQIGMFEAVSKIARGR